MEVFRFFHPFFSLQQFAEIYELTDESLLLDHLDFFTKLDAIFLCDNEKEEETLLSKNKDLKIIKKSISSGFVLKDINFALIPYGELIKKHKIRRQKWRTTTHTPSHEFHHLTPGDLVVHFHSGIGKYLGTEKQKKSSWHRD